MESVNLIENNVVIQFEDGITINLHDDEINEENLQHETSMTIDTDAAPPNIKDTPTNNQPETPSTIMEHETTPPTKMGNDSGKDVTDENLETTPLPLQLTT